MFRIAVITRYFPSSAEPWQGRSAYETIRILSRHAHVKVFYPHPSWPSWLTPRSTTYAHLDISYSVPDVQVNYLQYPALPLLSRISNGYMAARAVFASVRAFAPDLVLSYFVYPEGFAALKIARALAVPVVVTAIGSDINRITDPVTRTYTRMALRNTDFLLTVSNDLKKKAVAMGASPKKARTMLNGCDHSLFHVRDRQMARRGLGIDDGGASIVYIGRIDVKKGLRELVEAAAAVRLQHPNLNVYLVGSGPDREAIEKRIQLLHATSYIHLQGACAPDDVPLWIASSDLVALPSYMEGCPNIILEALACGRPVVATSVGGIPEILNEECGALVAPRDPGALAEALRTVLERHLDPMAISAHSSRSWTALASDYLKLFEELAGRGAARASF